MLRVIFLLSFLLSFISKITAQQVESVVATSGEHYSGNQYSLDFTLGELSTETVGNSTILTQGFHQPNIVITDISDVIPDLKVSIYPNPFSNQLIIDISEKENLNAEICDVNGKLLFIEKLSSDRHVLDVSGLVSGTYFLKIGDKKGLISSFKIIKSQ